MLLVNRKLEFIIIALTILQPGVHTNEIQQVKNVKVDCYPIEGATKEKCEALGCAWSPVERSEKYRDPHLDFEPLPSGLEPVKDDNLRSRVGEPWCYHPDDYLGYKPTQVANNEILLSRTRPSALGNDIQNLTVTLKIYERGSLARLTITDSDNKRFEPEIPKVNAQMDEVKSKFSMELEPRMGRENERYILTIKRVVNGAVVFSTDLGKLIYSDRFIQLNSRLSSPFVYGLGEHYDTFLKWADEYKVYSFWNTDRLTLPGGTRSYGGFPFFVNFDSVNYSMAHGVYLRNSNAMDIILQNDLSITFRPIGGILDFFLFDGPMPHDVISQYQHLVGLPDLPPRWALGFHLCRYDYKSLEKTKLVWKRTREAGIPFDVQWNDIDYMDRWNDFTYDNNAYSGLPQFVDELHSNNMHYVPLTDPGISQEPKYYPYDLGTQMDIWIKNATNQTLVGKVWNQSGRTVFPDFSNPESHDFWKEMFFDFHKLIKFDGAWIDMNDISNFVDGSLDGCPWESEIEQPPYLPGGYKLQTHTLCLSAQHRAGKEYDVHNLYSFYETIATKTALEFTKPGQRTFIISRSSHPGQGHYGGHWSGDVLSRWDYLRWSIPSLLEHSMYGFSMMGTDICGFAGNTNPQLCARWSTLGAFYTFSRNHNDDTSIDQDPVALGPEVVAANKNAYTKRYSLLPYLYTLMFRAHKFGQPVARSVAFEFFDQQDQEALKVEYQFMWGSALMISPIVFEDTHYKLTYLPEGRWYETDILPESMSFNASKVKVPKVTDVGPKAKFWHKTDNVALSNMPLFYRGGQIVPVYAKVRSNIPETEHKQPIALEVALCELGTARGELYMDDGESLGDYRNHVKMTADDKLGVLRIELSEDDYSPTVEFGLVKVMGMKDKVKQVEIFGTDKRKTIPFEQCEHLLIFDLDNLSVEKGKPITVRWSS
jgi:lysosomal alpha-glucosidase